MKEWGTGYTGCSSAAARAEWSAAVGHVDEWSASRDGREGKQAAASKAWDGGWGKGIGVSPLRAAGDAVVESSPCTKTYSLAVPQQRQSPEAMRSTNK